MACLLTADRHAFVLRVPQGYSYKYNDTVRLSSRSFALAYTLTLTLAISSTPTWVKATNQRRLRVQAEVVLEQEPFLLPLRTARP